MLVKENGKVVVMVWRDKQLVKEIITKHDDSMVTIQQRQKGNGGLIEKILKLHCIIDYNNSMNGVDKLDQKLSFYPCMRKTVKWTKKIFYYLMEICLNNAHILYKAKASETLLKF